MFNHDQGERIWLSLGIESQPERSIINLLFGGIYRAWHKNSKNPGFYRRRTTTGGRQEMIDSINHIKTDEVRQYGGTKSGIETQLLENIQAFVKKDCVSTRDIYVGRALLDELETGVNEGTNGAKKYLDLVVSLREGCESWKSEMLSEFLGSQAKLAFQHYGAKYIKDNFGAVMYKIEDEVFNRKNTMSLLGKKSYFDQNRASSKTNKDSVEYTACDIKKLEKIIEDVQNHLLTLRKDYEAIIERAEDEHKKIDQEYDKWVKGGATDICKELTAAQLTILEEFKNSVEGVKGKKGQGWRSSGIINAMQEQCNTLDYEFEYFTTKSDEMLSSGLAWDREFLDDPVCIKEALEQYGKHRSKYSTGQQFLLHLQECQRKYNLDREARIAEGKGHGEESATEGLTDTVENSKKGKDAFAFLDDDADCLCSLAPLAWHH